MARRNQNPDDPILATNRKAAHDYLILKKFECGIELTGTEVKSCRSRAVQLNESFGRVVKNQVFLCNAHISVCEFGGRFNHEVKRDRRLLLHKAEIRNLAQLLQTKGGALIPLKLYLKSGLIKVELAYCQGKTHGDQRDTIRQREAEIAIRRMTK